MSLPSEHGPGSGAQRPINLEDDSDSSIAPMDDEPLMEQVNDDEAAPMDEASPITELKDGAKPDVSPHVVTGEQQWVVREFSRRQASEKEYSDRFEVAGSNWRLLLYPRGNHKDRRHDQSPAAYLDCPDLDQEEPGWMLRASFDIVLVHPDDQSKNIVKQAIHNFHKSEADWGFPDIISHEELQSGGWLRDDELIFRTSVRVDTLESSCYDSKKEAGHVGLRNQGATCYLNSWLQTLFNINCFRQAVFHIPTTEEDEPTSSIPLALQALFYQLQFGNRAVSTSDLTKSFGWDSTSNFMQEDVHEFNKVLMEALEQKMKGTKVEGVINKLFEGRILKFIECLNVEYKSTKKDDYMDVFLDVKGCKNVYESFDRLTAEERLEGDNQYNAEGHGMQDAKIGDLFSDFPPVLQLHLKRFEYDFERDIRVKINDRYEFEETLDLDVGDRKYLSKDADTSKRNKYKLHSVLVHSGGTHGGHYYAYSRPDGHTWLRFDDEKVTREDARSAIEEQFGGDGVTGPMPGFNSMLGPRLSKMSSAYMLLYIREEEWDTVMCDVPEEAVALHLRQRIQAEEAERVRVKRERQEAHRLTVVKVATWGDMQAQIGDDVFFDLVDFSKVKSFRVQNETLLSDFREQLATELDVPRERQRLWFWEQRPNGTLRPSQPVPPHADEQPIKLVRPGLPVPKPPKQAPNELLLWLDTVDNADTALKQGEQVLVFVKLYDPRTSSLKLVSRLHLHPAMLLSRLADALANKLQLPKERTMLWEEVRAGADIWLDKLVLKMLLSRMEPQHGDILIAQEELPTEELHMVPHPTALAYLSYILMRRKVIFKRLTEPKEAGLRLELLGDADYAAIVEALATALELPSPVVLRLTQHTWLGGPAKRHIRWMEDGLTLDKLLPQPAANTPFVYFEVLDMPLEELEQMKDVEVALHHAKTEEVGRFQLRVKPGEMVVRDVLRLLRERAGATWDDRPLRLLQLRDSEIFKVYAEEDSVEDFSDYWQLAAHEIPADEASAAAAASARQEPLHLIRLRHILPPDSSSDKSAGTPRAPTAFGVPFVMAVSATETISDVADRIQQRLGVPADQFAAWRFKFVPDMSSRTEYLEEGNRVVAKFLRRSGEGQTSDGDYLGLEHPDTGPKRQKRAAPRDSFFERPMRIG